MASVSTRDHETIRRWADQNRAFPAVVSRTGGVLRFEFDSPGELSNINWDEFFRVFDERGLELIYDDKPGSRFHKFVYPETVAALARSGRSSPSRLSRSRPQLEVAASNPEPQRTPRRSRPVPAARTRAAGAVEAPPTSRRRAPATAKKVEAKKKATTKVKALRSFAKSRSRKRAA